MIIRQTDKFSGSAVKVEHYQPARAWSMAQPKHLRDAKGLLAKGMTIPQKQDRPNKATVHNDDC